MPVEKYDFDLQGFLALARHLVAEGASCSDIVIRLHEEGVSIVSSVEVVSDLYRTDMTTGKKIVFSHPIWSHAAENASVLHEALVEGLKREGKFTEKNGLLSVKVKL